MATEQQEPIEQLAQCLNTLTKGLRGVDTVNINKKRLRDGFKAEVQRYFREIRSKLLIPGINPDDLKNLDFVFQDLLGLSQSNSPKKSYLSSLKKGRTELREIAGKYERLIGSATSNATKGDSFNPIGRKIFDTLSKLLPSAAESYKQAAQDLKDKGRVSFRGTAVELRESLREVLDTLAPDEEVQKQPGFTFEEGQKKPTMKQKAKFVLKSRQVTENASKAPEDSAGLVEELTASLVRSTYQKGNVVTHNAQAKRELVKLQLYVDSVLIELLEVDPTD
jgi:hypothetical protein